MNADWDNWKRKYNGSKSVIYDDLACHYFSEGAIEQHKIDINEFRKVLKSDTLLSDTQVEDIITKIDNI